MGNRVPQTHRVMLERAQRALCAAALQPKVTIHSLAEVSLARVSLQRHRAWSSVHGHHLMQLASYIKHYQQVHHQRLAGKSTFSLVVGSRPGVCRANSLAPSEASFRYAACEWLRRGEHGPDLSRATSLLQRCSVAYADCDYRDTGAWLENAALQDWQLPGVWQWLSQLQASALRHFGAAARLWPAEIPC